MKKEIKEKLEFLVERKKIRDGWDGDTNDFIKYLFSNVVLAKEFRKK